MSIPPKPSPPPPALADLRRGRWFDDNPITPRTCNGGGAGMSSIEEVRGQIMQANEQANQSLGMLQQARADLEAAQQSLMHAVEGSGQQDASEAIGLYSQAIAGADDVIQQVSAAIRSSEDVAARL